MMCIKEMCQNAQKAGVSTELINSLVDIESETLAKINSPTAKTEEVVEEKCNEIVAAAEEEKHEEVAEEQVKETVEDEKACEQKEETEQDPKS
jgi:hypothetical protein